MTPNTADIGFEKELWAAADKLRGNMDASEYKSVVLGLIFLKYLSDRFDDRFESLAKEGEGFEDDRDEYLSESIFYVPPSARWSHIQASAHEATIGNIIDEAMMAIERENKRLENILPKNYGRPELDKRRLGEVVDLFSNVKVSDHGSKKDVLGRAYEDCLSMFTSAEGKRGGEFYPPACIVRTLVEILRPYRGRVYVPCCGSGGMFVQSAKFVEEHSGRINDISVYGQESNSPTWKMCMMNLAIRGIEARLGNYNADTFYDDQHRALKADYILANPPFNLSDWSGDKLKDDPRWQYGIPPKGNANFAWMQHMIYHLAPEGKLGLILAKGIDFIIGDEETKKMFLKHASKLRRTETLCRSFLSKEEWFEFAFFEAVRTSITRISAPGLSVIDINKRINALLQQSIESEGVVSVFEDLPEFSIFDPEFLKRIKDMKQKNVAVELLKRLLKDYKVTNIVQSELFSEKMDKLMALYNNRMITNAEVIAELLKMAEDIKDLHEEADALGLSAEEKAFYDALCKPEGITDFYKDKQLKEMTEELTKMLRKSRTIDWQYKESARAKMRTMIKRLLKKYKYPPEEQKAALETVIRQAELWAYVG